MNFKFLGLLSTLLLLTASCVTEENPMANGAGKVKASIKADNSVALSTSISRESDEPAAMRPDLNQFSLAITKEDGSYSHTWNKLEEFDPAQQFTTGAYTIEAFYGSIETEGFEKPYYHGRANMVIYDGETSEPSVIATLANTMVSIKYTDAFKKYFSDYKATIHSAGGAYIDFTKDETRPAYVRPGKISLELDLTKTTGTSFKFNPADIEKALPRTLYNVTFDVNGGEVGEAKLVITFDSSTVTEPIEIDLSDEILNAPAPYLKTIGYSHDTPINILEGDEASTAVKANIMALSGLKEVVLTTSSSYLISQGIPAELDLLAATDAQKTLLQNLGLKTTGLWTRPDKIAVVDFTGLFKNLRVFEGSSTHSFTIQVKDIYTKVSDPIKLSINAPSVQLALSNAGQLFIGQPSETVTLTYNGENLSSNIKIMAMNAYGAWEKCNIEKAEKTGDNSYKITFTIPTSNEALKFKAVYKDIKETTVVTVPRDNPNYEIAVNESDAWATSAFVRIIADDEALKSVMTNYITFYLKKGSEAYAKTTNIVKDAQNGIIEIKGLTPGTQYTIKGTLTSGIDGAKYSNEVTFTTESASAVPNGDFETLASTISGLTLQKGGRFRWTALGGYETLSSTINVNEPTGWASVNGKTCNLSASNKNTWFVIPSSYSISAAQSGSSAMEIRNVAWDLAGSTPGDYTSFDTSNRYNKNQPGNIANRSVGKLFLGSYTYNGGTETYNEGVAFKSRPLKLSGYFKYTRDGNDSAETGVVIVTLLNGTTVIGTGTAYLQPASDFTKFSVPVVYSSPNAKATSLKIMIASSNHASYTQSTETSNVKTTNYCSYSLQQSTGATLIVDNLSFSY